MSRLKAIACPRCGALLALRSVDPRAGSYVTCPATGCGVALRVDLKRDGFIANVAERQLKK